MTLVVSTTDLALVDGILVKHLKELVIVAVVHMDTDNYRSLSFERLLHDGDDVVGLVDHETRRTEFFGILDVVDWTEVDPRSAAVFQLLLHRHHFITAPHPYHLNDVPPAPHRRLHLLA